MKKIKAIVLQKYQGKTVNFSATARIATKQDHADFVVLQSAVHEAMPEKSLYVPSTAEELLLDVTKHCSIGVWVNNQTIAAFLPQAAKEKLSQTGETLIAYLTMRYDGATDHNYANYFEVSKEELPYWANLDSVLVRPEYRGNQLQQQLMELAIAWRDPKIIGVGCTISPENEHSLTNAQAMGLTIHSRRVMYGKHDRYLLQKRLFPLPGKYRHFKGNEYSVLELARHSETLAPMVVYQALYGEKGIWVRPAEMWFEWVEKPEYQGPRFVYLTE